MNALQLFIFYYIRLLFYDSRARSMKIKQQGIMMEYDRVGFQNIITNAILVYALYAVLTCIFSVDDHCNEYNVIQLH